MRLPFVPDLDAWLLEQMGRSRLRIAELERSHPGMERQQLAQSLIDEKKQWATSGGALAGVFGFASIPADLALVTWLQLQLAIDLAVLHGVNLKARSGRAELLDVIGIRESDISSIARAVPFVTARISGAFLRRLGWRTFGRAMPLLAAPIGAIVNGRDIQRVGDEAIRRFGTFGKVRTIRG